MDAKFTELVEQLNGLDFKGMYGSDFLHTWDKTTDELKALYIVADALRELRENNVSSRSSTRAWPSPVPRQLHPYALLLL